MSTLLLLLVGALILAFVLEPFISRLVRKVSLVIGNVSFGAFGRSSSVTAIPYRLLLWVVSASRFNQARYVLVALLAVTVWVTPASPSRSRYLLSLAFTLLLTLTVLRRLVDAGTAMFSSRGRFGVFTTTLFLALSGTCSALSSQYVLPPQVVPVCRSAVLLGLAVLIIASFLRELATWCVTLQLLDDFDVIAAASREDPHSPAELARP